MCLEWQQLENQIYHYSYFQFMQPPKNNTFKKEKEENKVTINCKFKLSNFKM
jgi:hypothetical protein